MISREDVLRMAREGAIAAGGDPAICTIEALSDTEADALVRFAALVAEHERAACEAAVRGVFGGTNGKWGSENSDRYEVQDETRAICAAAIRARGIK